MYGLLPNEPCTKRYPIKKNPIAGSVNTIQIINKNNKQRLFNDKYGFP